MRSRHPGAGPEVLITAPYLPYADRLMGEFARRYGARCVALYTDETAMRRHRRSSPVMRSRCLSASYLVDEGDLDGIADVLRSRHRIIGVAPVFETDVVLLAELADRLGVGWNRPDVVARFRDKAALKEHLRALPDGPRVNLATLVTSPADVQRVIRDHELTRAVLKPNDGYGNQAVRYVDATTSDAELAAVFADGGTVLLEEYLGGSEFYVNGQMDEAGEPHVYAVRESVREDLNGQIAVATGEFSVRTTRPEFEAAAEYARATMRATGLRRSPFHLELKIDDRGPCLLEVAARLCGGGVPFSDIDAHGGADLFAVAAHHFVTDEPYGPYPLDWAAYDTHITGSVMGRTSATGRIHSVRGLAEVETMPEFVRWDVRPHVGQRLSPTVDLTMHPWRAALRTASEADFQRATAQVRDLVQVNGASARGPESVRALLALAPPLATAVVSRMPLPSDVDRIG